MVLMCFRGMFVFLILGLRITLGADTVAIPRGEVSGIDPEFGAFKLVNEDPFCVDVTEVTGRQWREVCEWAQQHGYSLQARFGVQCAGDDYPLIVTTRSVVYVWCNARSEKEGFTPCYRHRDTGKVIRDGWPDDEYASIVQSFKFDGYRLPSAYEWEYAARGGKTWRFPNGDFTSLDQANYLRGKKLDADHEVAATRSIWVAPECDSWSYKKTSPVRLFPPNGFGLYGMTGNADEMINCIWREGAMTKGGSYCTPAAQSMIMFIAMAPAPYVIQTMGFRCVRRAGGCVREKTQAYGPYYEDIRCAVSARYRHTTSEVRSNAVPISAVLPTLSVSKFLNGTRVYDRLLH